MNKAIKSFTKMVNAKVSKEKENAKRHTDLARGDRWLTPLHEAPPFRRDAGTGERLARRQWAVTSKINHSQPQHDGGVDVQFAASFRRNVRSKDFFWKKWTTLTT